MRTASIALGDIRLDVDYTVSGGYAPATLIDPPEYPEIELTKLSTPGGEDITGLLEFEAVYECALEQIDDYERETNYGRDPDPDDAYDRRRDAELEIR